MTETASLIKPTHFHAHQRYVISFYSLQLQSISRRQTARFRSSGREFSGVKVSPTGAPSMWGQSLSNYAQEHQVCGVRVGVTVHYVQVLSWLRAAVGADKRGVGMSDEMSTRASLSRGLDRGGGGVVHEPVMQWTAYCFDHTWHILGLYNSQNKKVLVENLMYSKSFFLFPEPLNSTAAEMTTLKKFPLFHIFGTITFLVLGLLVNLAQVLTIIWILTQSARSVAIN